MFFRNFESHDPWREMHRIQREMNRLFNTAPYPDAQVYPALNMFTNADNIIVTAELPGYNPDDINISVVHDQLTIKGSRPQEKLKDEEQYHRQERRFGSFERIIGLPYKVNENKVNAEYKSGLLKITMPRTEADKPKKIAIEAKS